MARAPWPLGLLFALALALLITLTGPLLLFNPWLAAVLQARHDVPERLGATAPEVDRVTSAILADLYAEGDFDVTLQGEALLDARERSHMRDVSRLVRLLWLITGASAAAAAAIALVLRRAPSRVGRLMLRAAAAIAVIAVALGLTFALAFDQAFLAFHAVFFPPGSYLFEPGSDLIRLFPGGFWYDASLAAGGSILLTAILVAATGWRLARR